MEGLTGQGAQGGLPRGGEAEHAAQSVGRRDQGSEPWLHTEIDWEAWYQPEILTSSVHTGPKHQCLVKKLTQICNQD